jgi:hypothetical protein
LVLCVDRFFNALLRLSAALIESYADGHRVDQSHYHSMILIAAGSSGFVTVTQSGHRPDLTADPAELPEFRRFIV